MYYYGDWQGGVLFNIIFLLFTILIILGLAYLIQSSLKSSMEGHRRQDSVMDILKSGKKSVKSGNKPYTFHSIQVK